MVDKKSNKLIRLKNIYDLKKTMRTFWGALTSFQTQINTINGTVDEIRNLLEEVSIDIRDTNTDLNQIRDKLNKNART